MLLWLMNMGFAGGDGVASVTRRPHRLTVPGRFYYSHNCFIWMLRLYLLKDIL